MSRYVSWLANGTMLVLCCFLVANTANAVIASWLAPTPEEVAPAIAKATGSNRSWSERQVILDRNLFDAVLKVKNAPPPPPSEQLEATTLPLSLIGTAAAGDPALSWAAVQDHEARAHLTLQQGDSIKGKAIVHSIEPKRIVLRENGELRELALSDDPPAAARPKKKSRARSRPAARRPARTSSRRSARPPARTPPPAAHPLAGAAALLSQANLVPKFENGEMIGVQVDDVEAGSAFEAAGIQSGEVITELNGIRIDSPEKSQQALAAFTGSEIISIKVLGPDGNERDQELLLPPTP
jgi:general secretion pathway protein C